MLAAVVIRVDIRRGLVLESESSLLQSFNYLLSMSCWNEDVVGKIRCDEENGSTAQSAVVFRE